ncbi:MAG: hypothetical protein EOR30_32020 [Mesorhizobium sp.]|uniref:hypothetical protein n=1 Tax=Mesorhizobium sp. TaxID=1871066 RepID=UPI000FEA6B88|nr:hypothetical protein [Mesorhizobium sp.]RWI33313.1 MAG: hypothetical protein EOR14_33250 [Mesorhizobium sp.]RWI37057.1 MAG: hypothetical protein EOR14_25945 [Mesorhizobium sp.]RWI62639.1 MAG: hypothetical protein EOR17_32155 [Mesorhizobium sp.]RWI81462.1 MAG: hypothetical protein EOR20_32570 [Mesorhizobium sp.]RWJ42379.1 MAG: hypothetical protein EOR30_32020 [Mesorhizobium sp.]
MMPKVPKWQDGREALESFKQALHLYETTIRAKAFREFYRKDLSSAARRYRTLAEKRSDGSEAQTFYFRLSELFERQLAEYGTEPPPKRRPSKWSLGVPLAYPDIPDELTLRVHFPATGSLKRAKATAMAQYADHVSEQKAPSGDVLPSAAVGPERAQFFEHLIEATGAEGLYPPRAQGTFEGWVRSDGTSSAEPDWNDDRSPWVRIRNDNDSARLFHWSPRRLTPPSGVIHPDISWIPDSLPWDTDPRFREVLAATQRDQLREAVELVETIPAAERDLQFDEMIYLRFPTGLTPRGDDLRYLAGKFIARSTLHGRLAAEFDDFIKCLDAELAEAGPITGDFPGFGDQSRLYQNGPSAFVRNTPPLSDWQATRQHYRQALNLYGHPIAPRGRSSSGIRTSRPTPRTRFNGCSLPK